MKAFDLSVPGFHFVETESEARRWLNHFLQTHKKNGGLGLDSETTGLVTHKDIVIVWSLSDGVDRICLESKFIDLFREPILENPEINFDMTNAKYDAHMFANSGADISKAGEWRDTSQQSWLLNENNRGRHGLKECVFDHFGRVTPTFEQTFGKKPANRKGMPEITIGDMIRAALLDPEKRERAADYASLDAYNSTTLRAHLDKLLDKIQMYEGMTLKQFFYAVEAPFTKLLWRMEREGVTIDLGHLKEAQAPMEAELRRIEKEFAKAAGRIMNLAASAEDPKWFFFEVLKKPVIKWTDGGTTGVKKPSLDADVLDEWAGQGDQYARLLLKYREVATVYGTVVMGLQKRLDRNQKIHTTLNQHGTVTGRLSSSDPNLQNIKRPSEDPYLLRDAFVSPKDELLMVADYEQLEMRLTAHFSEDEKMIDAILRGIDLHCLTVAEIYGFPYDEVVAAKKAEKKAKDGSGPPLTEHQEYLLLLRQAAKATGFGIIYGIGGGLLAANLTKDLGTLYTKEQGEELIEKWFGVFPGVKRCKDDAEARIWKYGYVQTIMGRYRRFGDLKGMGFGDRAQAERQALNSIIQGSAADIAKMAMLNAEKDPELNAMGCKLLLQVHDELMWRIPNNKEIIQKAKARAKAIMENPFGQALRVPLPVEVGTGYSWAGAK